MKTICFSGMDGCGKSTQSKILKERIEALGISVASVHMLSKGATVASNIHKVTIFSKLNEKVRSLPEHSLGRTIKLVIGLIYYFFDAWLTNISYRIKHRKKLIIYDRFFYDQFAIFVSTFKEIPWGVINFVKILPHSDLDIIIGISVDLAVKRKPEHSGDQLARYARVYKRLSEILNVEMIDGAQDKMKLADYIYKKYLSLLEKR